MNEATSRTPAPRSPLGATRRQVRVPSEDAVNIGFLPESPTTPVLITPADAPPVRMKDVAPQHEVLASVARTHRPLHRRHVRLGSSSGVTGPRAESPSDF